MWVLVALVIGSPWYIEFVSLHGQPCVSVLLQSIRRTLLHAADAAGYDQSNSAFGMGRSLDGALTAPWNMTMYPLPGHAIPVGEPKQSFNDYQTFLAALSPLLLAALFFPAFAAGPAPPVIRALGVPPIRSVGPAHRITR